MNSGISGNLLLDFRLYAVFCSLRNLWLVPTCNASVLLEEQTFNIENRWTGAEAMLFSWGEKKKKTAQAVTECSIISGAFFFFFHPI